MITNQNKHQKHGKTVKASFGEFGRLEIGIMGTPCGNIKQLAGEIIEKLNTNQLAYVDADHKTSDEEIPQYIKQGSTGVYTNKIEFHRLDLNKEPNKFERNGLFNEYDLVIINGNHFTANAQLLVIDEKKPLEKKLDKITNPKAIIFTDTSDTIPNYLKDKFPDIEKLPQFSLSQAQNISDFIKEYIKSNRPSLNGLVLSGGKSTRMQRDKSVIDYHGLPQREHLFHMLNKNTAETFISCRKDQLNEFNGQFDIIPDSIDELGPYGAILSAFRKFPNNAWLVIACDLPLLSEETIQYLIENRNPSKIATAFYNPATDFPEPLITIWEPKAYPVLLHFLGLGYSCPRKALINSDIELIEAPNPDELMNVNNPEEYEKVVELLSLDQNK